MTETYDYRAGTDVIVEVGAMRPFGRRVLCRSIFSQDAYRGPLKLVQHNSTDADCFEVIAIGGSVEKWCADNGEAAPRVGQHVDIRSTAADRVNQRDPTGRYWLVPIEDVTGVWDPCPVNERLIAAVDAVNARTRDYLAVSDTKGAVELVPG